MEFHLQDPLQSSLCLHCKVRYFSIIIEKGPQETEALGPRTCFIRAEQNPGMKIQDPKLANHLPKSFE